MGAYADGFRISTVQHCDLKIGVAKSIPLRLGATKNAANNSGFTLFGYGFGNYSQGISVRMVDEELKRDLRNYKLLLKIAAATASQLRAYQFLFTVT